MADTLKNTTPETQNRSEQVKSLRTFESDAADVLKSQRTTAAQIVIAEQVKPREMQVETVIPTPPKDPTGRNRLLLIASGLFFAAGIVVVIAYLILKPTAPPSPATTNVGQPIISVDVEKTINLTNLTPKKILEAIVRERDTATLRLNSTETITFTEKDENGVVSAISTASLLPKLSPSVPLALLRALQSKYVFGIVAFDGNQPFLLLRTDSYDNAYNGMLKWEADLYREAGSIFVRSDTRLLPGLSTTTDAYFGTSLGKQLFFDAVIHNTDARVVKNDRGEVVFLYAFPDQSTILITTNGKTFSEILQKLRRAKLVK